MAESAFLDDGSHLDHKIISADHIRRNEICWPVPAAASQHRTLSKVIDRRSDAGIGWSNWTMASATGSALRLF
ncbi:hypothetical protein, partial [Sphingopyxis indica]|uniref:hypothetical protein n=1 Tax=Sphingopyxis indica TaxID=436663 RepID=UPI00148332CA